jgi:hypothetical protein
MMHEPHKSCWRPLPERFSNTPGKFRMPLRAPRCHDQATPGRGSFDFIAGSAFIAVHMNVIGHIIAGALATQRVARINAARDRLLRHRGGAAEAQPA